MTNTDLAECTQCLCLASRRASRTITRAFDKQLRAHGLRATQFTLLVNLALRGVNTISALADALGLERTTLTRNLRLIEDKGWVKIRPGEDARARDVEITSKGRALVNAALPAWRHAQKSIRSAIGDAGASALLRLAGRASR